MERSLIAMAMSVGVYVIGITSLLAAFAGAHNVLQFGYTGSIGPAKWGSLSPPFIICSNGTYQSPINIIKKDAVLDPKLKPLVRDYVDANSTLIDTGFNIALKFSGDAGSVLIDAKNYSLKQLQWHSPSEHTIDGVRYPVELQLVHTSADGNIAVVAILYQYGDPDPFLSKLNGKVIELAKEVCGEDEEAHIPVGVIETKGMRRSTRKYFRYVGSLTSPPCTENVIWTILGKVREISKEQVEALKAPLDVEYRNNSRPIQVLNGRKVYLYSEGDGDGDDSD